ncbi:MAG: T9SS type A sorting domain-containing protein [Bacteroidales bacterium]|nr:T9SS type A sorting domain-containing protein [Bacteroidales bacterium]
MMEAQKRCRAFQSGQIPGEIISLIYFLKAGRQIIRLSLIPIFLVIAFTGNVSGQYQIEDIDRGIVAVKTTDTSVFISWRLLATDPDTIAFNVYRGDIKINDTLVVNSTNYIDSNGTSLDTYHVIPVLGGVEQVSSDTVTPWNTNYRSVPLQIPAGGTVPGGTAYTYNANDCSTADLDGDGEYEIVLKWDPSNSKDNSQSGYTGNVILDAYELDGTHLWRIDLGINIRAGAHYTQFMVYDLDGDGKAEVACKTAPGTKDGSGNFIKSGPADSANHAADYRNTSGYILTGPEYFTIFSGENGYELATTLYIPPRGNVGSWGDSDGNRVDRFLACIAYLDGSRPSVVMCRGYYLSRSGSLGRTVLAAWDYRDNALTHRWTFNADKTGENSAYTGQGNHNLSVADVDNDGKDEIIYGSCAIDDDGTGLWTTGLGHGDAMHVSDIDPTRQGLEVWGIHENAAVGSALLDAKTGAIIWGTGPADVGRGVAADLIASVPGMECWGGTDGLRSAKNEKVGYAPGSSNYVIWWDSDLQRELLDHNFNDVTRVGIPTITKYNGANLLTATGTYSNNDSKGNPCLQADILGDWREEVILRTTNSSALWIYTTIIPTGYRLTTLMHDHVYRMGIAWQNVAYNQPPHLGFYLSPEMFLPDSLRPPIPPYNLTAKDLNDTVKLTWDNNIEPDLAGYNLYRSEVTEGNFIRLNDTLIFANAYVDSVVTNDVSYFYKVTAVDTLGNESRDSDVIKAVPTLRPAAPTELYARNDNKKVKLFWNANTTDDVVGYNIYRSKTSGSGYIKLNLNPVTESEFQNINLTNNTTYYFRVTSVDGNAVESFFSEEIAVTAGPVTYLQENEGIISGGSIDNNNLGFNGTGFYNFAATSTIDFIHIGGDAGGNYMLVYRYAMGNTSRTGSLVVNDVAQSLTMKTTAGWTTYVYDSVVIVLNPGFTNTIRFAATGGDFGNLDEITVKPTTVSGIFDQPATPLTALSGIYPNPFTDRVNITYTIGEPCMVSVQILNMLGQPVRTLVNNHHDVGKYEISWDAVDVSGKEISRSIYFCRLTINNRHCDIKKMIMTGE